MDPFTIGAILVASLFGAAAIFVLLWNRYRDKIREWNVSNNLESSLLSKAVVRLDRLVTGITAKVRVRRKDWYYDEVVFEERLTQEQIDALREDRPDLFKTLEQGQSIDVDILSDI